MSSAPLVHEAVSPPEQSHASDMTLGPIEPSPCPEHEGKKSRHGGKPAHHADALTIWVKENRQGEVRASGNLDIGGQKFSLDFTHYYHALERVEATGCDPVWRSLMAGEMADAIVPVEQSLDGIAARSTMSALFGKDDGRALKDPVMANIAVILEWQAGKPVGAVIVDGVDPADRTMVQLSQQTGERFKGAVRMAA